MANLNNFRISRAEHRPAELLIGASDIPGKNCLKFKHAHSYKKSLKHNKEIKGKGIAEKYKYLELGNHFLQTNIQSSNHPINHDLQMNAK